MKTQCVHCLTIYNPPDETRGKKVTCPKCHKAFIIVPYVEGIKIQAKEETVTEAKTATVSEPKTPIVSKRSTSYNGKKNESEWDNAFLSLGDLGFPGVKVEMIEGALRYKSMIYTIEAAEGLLGMVAFTTMFLAHLPAFAGYFTLSVFLFGGAHAVIIKPKSVLILAILQGIDLIIVVIVGALYFSQIDKVYFFLIAFILFCFSSANIIGYFTTYFRFPSNMKSLKSLAKSLDKMKENVRSANKGTIKVGRLKTLLLKEAAIFKGKKEEGGFKLKKREDVNLFPSGKPISGMSAEDFALYNFWKKKSNYQDELKEARIIMENVKVSFLNKKIW